MFQPLTFEQSEERARSVLRQMTPEEKLAYIAGDKMFFIRAIPGLGLREVYMSDATQGVHLRDKFGDTELHTYQPEKSTAFPSPILLAATWNPRLAYRYAEAIGEECRAGGIGILLGPGMNIYRQAQCGRNFEYFGEDPYLAARMIEQYVMGVQSTGTVATLKHFVANNTDYFRRKSNSIVDERTLHEIYMPAFKAGVDAGAKAVMTSYNLLNGEWCGQSRYVITELLRKRLGFQWLVMTDWSSVYDCEKLVTSGQDLEMPQAEALAYVRRLYDEGKVHPEDIDRMVMSILRTYYSMRLSECKKQPLSDEQYDAHEQIALQTAREGIVLLKNEGDILPLTRNVDSILVTGTYVKRIAAGGGSAAVDGFNDRTLLEELISEFGRKIQYVENPTLSQIKSADIVLCNVGTFDSEGWDRPFELPEEEEKRVTECVRNNPNTVVLVTSGSGIRMTGWNDTAKAILYAWYGGQTGNKALVEILSGKTNPSGKLPITIEREFSDSPGYGYIPEGETLYLHWNDEEEKKRRVYDIRYKEGIFVGYRWYERNGILPLYPFGFGLTYTKFEYGDPQVNNVHFHENDIVTIRFTVKNTGAYEGAEVAQVYVQDVECSVPRPPKELKAFRKVELHPGESKELSIDLDKRAFSFWSPALKTWIAERGKFILHIGSSSRDIRLTAKVELI
jgi:beta-glucosidase